MFCDDIRIVRRIVRKSIRKKVLRQSFWFDSKEDCVIEIHKAKGIDLFFVPSIFVVKPWRSSPTKEHCPLVRRLNTCRIIVESVLVVPQFIRPNIDRHASFHHDPRNFFRAGSSDSYRRFAPSPINKGIRLSSRHNSSSPGFSRLAGASLVGNVRSSTR